MEAIAARTWIPSAERLPEPLRNPWATFGWVILAIVVWFLAQLPFGMFLVLKDGAQGLGAEPKALEKAMMAANPGLILLATAAGQVVFVIAALLLVMKRPLLNQLALDRGPSRGWLDYVIGFGLCIVMGSVINSFRQYVLGHDIYADLKQLDFLFRIPIWPLSFVVVALLAPAAEELLFRGVLLPGLARTWLGFWGAALVSTLVWTALHVGNAYSIAGMLLVFLLGIIFSWMFAVTGSLRVPIAAHMLNNALACMLLQTGWV